MAKKYESIFLPGNWKKPLENVCEPQDHHWLLLYKGLNKVKGTGIKVIRKTTYMCTKCGRIKIGEFKQ